MFRDLVLQLLSFYEYLIDSKRVVSDSKSSFFINKNKKFYYEIILLAHTVEKGLSVKDIREGFGKVKITKLLSYLEKYDWEFDVFPVEKSYGCLNNYKEWHDDRGVVVPHMDLINLFLNRAHSKGLLKRGGVNSVNGDRVAKNLAAEKFLLSRCSIRRYLPIKVSSEDLDSVFKIALRTPSQCNRQSGRIHIYQDKEKINHLLKLQAGAEGFRENVMNLLVITTELSAWSGYKARSQPYVDGSLLSMQVLNAFHALGIGSCPLNLAITNNKEKMICNEGQIPKNERLIMMIAFGYPEADSYMIANSERISIPRLVITH